MKTKQILFLMCSLLLLFGAVGCDKNEAVPDDLIGRWILAGFGDEADNSYKEAEQPKSCAGCINLQIKKDKTLGAQTLLNQSTWTPFIIIGNRISFPDGFAWTKIGEIDGGDGNLFASTLGKISHFSIENSKLKLFYSKTEYMLFNKDNREL